jgi:hypothetical protein
MRVGEDPRKPPLSRMGKHGKVIENVSSQLILDWTPVFSTTSPLEFVKSHMLETSTIIERLRNENVSGATNHSL